MKARILKRIITWSEMGQQTTQAKEVYSPQTKTILFQNVRSLHLHIDDVRSDYNIQKADVNNFVESKLCLSDRDDTYQLNEFTLYSQSI